MSVEDKYKNINLKKSISWTVWIMTCAGYWLPKSSTKKTAYLRFLYMIVIVISTTVLLLITEISYLLFNARDLEDLVDASFLMLTHASQSVKLLFLTIGRTKVLNWLDSLDNEIMFKPKNLRQFQIAEEIIKYSNLFSFTALSVLSLTIVFFCGFPALDGKFPAQAVFPFNISETHYKTTYIYQALAIGLSAYGNAGVDVTAAALMSQICIQLEFLSDNIQHIRDLAEINLKKRPIITFKTEIRGGVSKELEEEMKKILKNCVEHHLKILKLYYKKIL